MAFLPNIEPGSPPSSLLACFAKCSTTSHGCKCSKPLMRQLRLSACSLFRLSPRCLQCGCFPLLRIFSTSPALTAPHPRAPPMELRDSFVLVPLRLVAFFRSARLLFGPSLPATCTSARRAWTPLAHPPRSVRMSSLWMVASAVSPLAP